MRPTLLVFRREFAAYFATPVAAVFLIVFLALAAGLTFFMSGFFDRGQADLSSFFFWHPWLFLVLMPAIATSNIRPPPSCTARADPIKVSPISRRLARKRQIGACYVSELARTERCGAACTTCRTSRE